MNPIFSSNNNRRPALFLFSITVVSFCIQACGPAERVDEYVSKLKSNNPQVRKSALEQIGRWYSHEECVQDCPNQSEFHKLNTTLIVLLSDPDPEIRLQAVRYLSASTDGRILGPFAKLFDDTDSRVRATVAEAFMLIGLDKEKDVEIVRGLERLLKDSSNGVRESATLALRTNGDRNSLTALRKAYAQEHDASVKQIMDETIKVLQEHLGNGKTHDK
jgi:HEAT repeat protein